MEFDFYELAKQEGIKVTKLDEIAMHLEREKDAKMRDYSEILLELEEGLRNVHSQAIKGNFKSSSGWAAHCTKLSVELSVSLLKM